MSLGSNNSNRGNLCGKVPFALEPQRKFIHSPMWSRKNFSTGFVKEFFTIVSPQLIFPHSTAPVDIFKGFKYASKHPGDSHASGASRSESEYP